MQVTVEDEKLIVRFQYNPNTVATIKTLPRREYDPITKTWSLPLKDYPVLIKLFPSVKEQRLDDIFKEYLNNKEMERVKKEEQLCKKVEINLKPVGGRESILRKYQEEAVNFTLLNKNSILNLAIGCGKTITAICTALVLKKCKPNLKVLIVCPTSLKWHWESEIEKFTEETSVIIEGNFKKRKELYNNMATFTIVNYETVRITKDLNILSSINWDLIIADEVTKIKNSKTKNWKSLNKLKTSYKIGLTGSIIENNLNDLYSILSWINPRIFGGYWDFRKRYMIYRKVVMGYQTWDELVGYKNLDELKKVIHDVLMKKGKREILKELPPRVEKIYLVDLDKKQRNLYENIENEAWDEVEEGCNPLAKLTYLRQAVNAPETIQEEGIGSKIGVLKEILEEIGIKKKG